MKRLEISLKLRDPSMQPFSKTKVTTRSISTWLGVPSFKETSTLQWRMFARQKRRTRANLTRYTSLGDATWL